MLDLSLDHNILINSELEAAVQELNILFSTETTELINHPTFGTNFEQFLWQMTPAPDALKQYINEKISNTLFLSQLCDNIQVNVIKGELRMIYNVEVHLKDKQGNTTTKKFQFR